MKGQIGRKKNWRKNEQMIKNGKYKGIKMAKRSQKRKREKRKEKRKKKWKLEEMKYKLITKERARRLEIITEKPKTRVVISRSG